MEVAANAEGRAEGAKHVVKLPATNSVRSGGLLELVLMFYSPSPVWLPHFFLVSFLNICIHNIHSIL